MCVSYLHSFAQDSDAILAPCILFQIWMLAAVCTFRDAFEVHTFSGIVCAFLLFRS